MGSIGFSQVWNSSNKQWNPKGLDSLFSGEQELKQIQSDLNSIQAQESPGIATHSETNQDLKKSGQEVKRSGRALLAITMQKIYSVLSRIFHWIGLEKLSNYFLVRSIHCKYNLLQTALSLDHKGKLLLPLRNVHRLGTEDFYLRSPIGNSEFCSPGGVCRGISDWFSYLYLKSQSLLCDTDQRMTAVGRLFAQGAPAQSTLLQANIPALQQCSFWHKVEKSQPMHVVSDLDGLLSFLALGAKSDAALSSCLKDFLTSKKAEGVVARYLQSSQNSFKKLHEGVYSIDSHFLSNENAPLSEVSQNKASGHAMTYVKVNEQLSYIVDSNLGVLKFSSSASEEASAAAYEYIRRTYPAMKLLVMTKHSLAASDSKSPASKAPELNLLDESLAKLMVKIAPLIEIPS